MPTNPYDEIRYPTFPRLESHPDRLCTVGILFGMEPAPVTNCRLLEIGSGDGSNLIPMAYALPGSRFLGIDLAPGAVESGRAAIETLGLTNIRLEAGDLREIGEEAGEFDYIVAHGVYSWVPAEVRDALLRVSRERLARNGIAFVSYNAYPGRHIRQMLREMMLYHIRGVEDPGERIGEGRRFLERVRQGRMLAREWRELMDSEIEHVLNCRDGGLYHDDLAAINHPVYFREFAEHAARHGLAYLGDASVHEMFDPRGALGWLAGDVLEREQYLDFLRLRRFRQTLLCHEGVVLDRNVTPEHLERFRFSAPARVLEDGLIEGLHGVRITAVHQAVNRVTAALGEVYPFPLAFDELVPYAGDRENLREILYGLMLAGFASLHVHDFPCADEVTDRPRASALARYQAARSPYVTSACHHTVELDATGRLLVPLLDGTRTHLEIARALAALPEGPSETEAREHLGASLEWLARMGVLEA